MQAGLMRVGQLHRCTNVAKVRLVFQLIDCYRDNTIMPETTQITVDAILFDMDGQPALYETARALFGQHVNPCLSTSSTGTLVDSTRATDETFKRFVQKHNLDLSGHPHASLC